MILTGKIGSNKKFEKKTQIDNQANYVYTVLMYTLQPLTIRLTIVLFKIKIYINFPSFFLNLTGKVVNKDLKPTKIEKNYQNCL